MQNYILKTAAILLCLVGLFFGTEKCAVYAKDEQPVTSFSGDIAVLRQENNGYVMQVTVGNDGEDFTGTVQIIFAGMDDVNTAYNTDITLPAQGKKQFTVSVANTAADTTNGAGHLNFLDEKGNILQTIQFKDAFGNEITELLAGVLSEDYDRLSFMEMKGEMVNIYHNYYPLKLTELNNSNLKENLEELHFLIIDRFDVSSLSRENIELIQDWVKNGGLLIIGTGEYAEQTLSGFDGDFLDVSVSGVSEPGEENIISANAYPHDYDYYRYTDDGIDFIDLAIADLDYNKTYGNFYMSIENPVICSALGDGAVMIFYCCLGDEELQKVSNYTVSYIYEELLNGPSGYSYDDYSEWDYLRQRTLEFIDKKNTNVDFTGLKVMIGLYVVLVGPVLYLILRKCKKCEWYWLAVPAVGVLFIAGVYFLGMGNRVNEAIVYSVTAQRADSNHKDTYFLAYHAGTDPWKVALKEEYEMAGPGSYWDGYYHNGYYGQGLDDYYYAVQSDSEGLSAGIKPEENFDSGFFYAEGTAEIKGAISCDYLGDIGRGKREGQITNGTDCDMSYMAVWYQNSILVFSDVKAGETIDLKEDLKGERLVYENYVSYIDELVYDMIPLYSNYTDADFASDDMAALVVGLSIADNAKPLWSEQAVIIGVVRDYDRITADRSNEISYGCLYSYVNMEGGWHASN